MSSICLPRHHAVAYLFLVRYKTMSFQKNVDEKIKEAIARGEFDNLPGKGKPLDLMPILPRLNI
jgi:hypothetical protein